MALGNATIPISATYHFLSDGMSTITVTPDYGAGSPFTGLASVFINANDYENANGDHLSGSTSLTFDVYNPQNSNPGSPPSITINPLPALTVEPGSTLTYAVTASVSVAGQSLVYSLGQGAPAGASINPLSGLFTWTPTASQAGATYSIPLIAALSGELNDYSSAFLSVTVALPPSVASVKATPLEKGHKNKGIGTITVTFSQAMAESAGSSSFYSVVTPKIVRVHKKKETRLVPVPFTSKMVAPTRSRSSSLNRAS